MQVLAEIEYKRLQQIGQSQGRNSEVYLIDEPQLGGEMVVKEVAKSNLQAASVSNFFSEAQVMFEAAHPNVMPIQYASQNATHICLVMPRAKGGSLQDRIDPNPISVREALGVADGVLAGLGWVHGKGYVHFDVKPTNVLFDADTDTPMLADFGQARLMLATGFALVPAFYPAILPPEGYTQYVGTVATDIYQVGLLLQRALNGERWYQDAKAKPTDLVDAISRGKFPPRNEFLPHIPPRLRTLIRKAVKVEPTERFDSAADFRAALCRVQLAIDWQVAMSGQDVEWTGKPSGKAELLVRLGQTAAGWTIEVLKKTARGSVAHGRTDYWTTKSTRAAALRHLDDVFKALGAA